MFLVKPGSSPVQEGMCPSNYSLEGSSPLYHAVHPESPYYNKNPKTPDDSQSYNRLTIYANVCPGLWVPFAYNLLPALFSWIALAGFLVFLTTFTSLNVLGESHGGKVIRHTLQSLPLLKVANVCCIIGLSSTLLLCLYWRGSIIWTSSICL